VGYKEMGGKGGRENGGRKKERKKEHMRKNEEERANDLCITQGRQPQWHPWCTTGCQGGWCPSWWDPGPDTRAPGLMTPVVV
jgi:hypothetical protein